ncbi:MAG: DNA polymerase III subunit gamma/tau [Candidatus Cyclonatronum sp.]|uniref:DNA polymerase III subunit gamma/tau n=1 Tax=Cyclonatronum sp. TaxID=3024185 RepID=UPI0025BAC71D|nr:DNA polymerase III subunit gamma/tau [Cyclonatronum sp.]MCH8485845.1 DNA polymerase III subunit gamma/tau [Cyclonatronum sp.]
MSEHYKALTRKYRPVHFEDIVSQEHVSSTLKNAIENGRISHAYLFCGPRGVGKTTMARVLARTLNEIGDEVDGEMLNQTLNIIEVDAASNNKVDDAHRIRESVRVPPQSGKYKIFIIDEVHMLSKQAFNALLKTLEEPPAYAIFIFATTEPHKVLPTILSRVQRFDFKPITVKESVERLRFICERESISIDEDSLHMIALKADGALRDALGILDQVIALCGTDIRYEELMKAFNAVGLERLFELTGYIEQGDSVAGIQLISDLLMEGHDVSEFLGSLTGHMRNLMLARDPRNFYAIETSKEVKLRLNKAAQAFSDDDLMRMLHIVHEAQFRLRDAKQPRILLEMTILKLIRMEKTDGLSGLMQELQQLRKAVAGGAVQGKLAAPAANANVTASDPADYRTAEAVPSEKPKPAAAPKPAVQIPGAPPVSGLRRKPGMSNKRAEAVSTPTTVKKPAPETSQVHTAGDNVSASASASPSPSETASLNAPKPKPVPAELPPEDALLKPVSSPAVSQPVPAPAVARVSVSAPQQAPVPSAGEKQVYLHQVQQVWEAFIKALRPPVPQSLILALDRVKPVDLRGRLLTLETPDPFLLDMLETNNRILGEQLEQHIGTRLRLQGRLLHVEQKQSEEEDPFAKFERLQKQDPKLRQIVELFGAEIDWNYR